MRRMMMMVMIMGVVMMVMMMMMGMVMGESVMGVNWGTQSSHPLPASVVVPLLKSNSVKRLKLFDANSAVLRALGGTDIEVMVGIPNDQLKLLNDLAQAHIWVENNIARYLLSTASVNIRYVAVGNEPFLTSYNGSYIGLTLPALENVQTALNNANYGDKIKATIPLNADVLQTSNTFPSGGSFRPEIATLMTRIVAFLNQNSCPFTMNVYPFISLYSDKNFPMEYAFFDGAFSLQDGVHKYQNVFDASYDTLVTALTRIGHPNMQIIIGEIGWPTDGDIHANLQLAQRFNQGFLTHMDSNVGTPLHPNKAITYYLFSLLDEDKKAIEPGNFERHWGLFRYNGQPKYSLSSLLLVGAPNVHYLPRRWCVLNPSGDRSNLGESVSYACENSDCTQLGYGCSCNQVLDAQGNASFAFNKYFQIQNQDPGTCNFGGLGVVVEKDPSVNTCLFEVGLAYAPTSIYSTSNAFMGRFPPSFLNRNFFVLTTLVTLLGNSHLMPFL